VALDQAWQVIFLIDGRTEITGVDRELARMLHKLGKPVSLVVNKIDHTKREGLMHEFHALGFKHLFPVSAEHRIGLEELLDHVTHDFPVESEEEATGSERAIVSPVAGTTRDAVDETIERDGTVFTFVDTAGIRRKGKTKEMAEKLSVVMARRHLRMSHVALLVLDATEGVLALDATIAGYAHEEGRAVILVVNKWDVAADKDKRKFVEQIRDTLKFLDYAPVAFVSAQKRAGVNPLYGLIQRVYASASRRVTTGELNRFVETLHWEYDMKIYYITQTSFRPPSFLVFTDKAGKMHFSAERFLINRLREKFGFEGTPIAIKTKRR
jgi:GTP-binding protein